MEHKKHILRLLFSERVKKYRYGPQKTLKVIFTNSPQIIVHIYFKIIIILFRQNTIFIILFPQSINMLFKVMSSAHKISLTLRTDLEINIYVVVVQLFNTLKYSPALSRETCRIHRESDHCSRGKSFHF